MGPTRLRRSAGSSARIVTRGRSPARSSDGPGPPGSWTRRRPRGCPAELAGRRRRPPRHRPGRHADRGLLDRRRTAPDPGPRRIGRPHDVPGRRAAPGVIVHGPRHRPTRARRVRRRDRLRHRARVRGRGRGRGGRRRGRRRGGSTWPAIPTAAGARWARACATDAIRRIVSYEGAPTPAEASYHPAGVEERLRAQLDAGDGDGALATFLREIVGMSEPDLAAYRADPVWPLRAAAAGTILRELEAEADPGRVAGDPRCACASPSCSCSVARASRSSATRRSRSTNGWRTDASW